MQQDILINWSPQETRVAVVEHGAVQELHIERTLERGLVGNVYLGKVSRVLPGMQSAFIDIGLERAAFLHVADVWQRQEGGEPPLFARRNDPPVPIEKQVFEGQPLMVQVIKDPHRQQGCTPVHADQHRRSAAGVPAAGRPCGRLAKNPPGRPGGPARAAAGAGG
jgi:ribonuclease G